MTQIFSNALVDRRTALATLASAGVGLWAMSSSRVSQPEGTSDALASILSDFKDESRKKLTAVLAAPDFSGQITTSVVKGLLASEQKNVAALMLGLLPLARTYSHPPISDYHVGAVARGASGDLYLGFNIEFPGQALGFAVHGEQAALSNAYMHNEEGVSAIAVTAAPCGHCRQFMNELAPDGQLEVLVDGAAPVKMASLLPMAFGPKDLGRKEGAFPVRETNLTPAASSDALMQAAWEAARKSYAPYTGSHSGVAIATRAGRIYKGSYIENVAFNPSLSPFQTALVQLIVAGEEYSEVFRVVLAETKGAKISQRSVTEAVMSAVTPGARVETVDLGK